VGNREDLVAGAIRCLRERGWGRTTVRDIAAAAGVSHAAIGYHFGSREALLNQAVVAALAQWGEGMGRAVATSGRAVGTSDPQAAMWDALVRLFTEERQLAMASVDALVQSDHEDALRDLLAEGQRQARRGLAAEVLGVDESEVSERDAATVGSVQLALISGVMLQWLTSPADAPRGEDVVAGLRELVRGAGGE
jgi:AcrR family transcriptional regulator